MAVQHEAVLNYWQTWLTVLAESQDERGDTNSDSILWKRMLLFFCGRAALRNGSIFISSWNGLADEPLIKSDPAAPDPNAPKLRFYRIQKSLDFLDQPRRVMGSALVHRPFSMIYVGPQDNAFSPVGEIAIQVSSLVAQAEVQRGFYTEALNLLTLGRETA